VSAIEGFPHPETAAIAPHGGSIQAQLAALRRLQDQHALWDGALLASFAQGALSRDDLRYVFSQYHLYTSSFTRFIAAVMASCENDLFRAQLSENLWEEGGGREPARRHAQIFRMFLQRSLGIDDVDQIEYAPYTRHFVHEYLDHLLRCGPAAGAASLSLGTESIVARMYVIMRSGLRRAGIPDGELEFFDIHIACDDAHAATLETMMVSYAHQPGWFDTCAAAANHALALRAEFFDNIFEALRNRRLAPLLQRVQARESLAHGVGDHAIHHRPGASTIAMYANEVEKLNVQFTVERLPLAAEVLDPRMVRIPAGKYNEKHKHAHETLIHILEGDGQVLVDDRVFPVRPGDTVIVPRWAFLAVTDFAFSQRAYLGDATDYRMHADIDARQRNGAA
jgi:pyrroloquinoline quinone (PQQ) biosynthesis protein C/mannose-6-phosphate isomerase-like protein (cupin superfamily)